MKNKILIASFLLLSTLTFSQNKPQQTKWSGSFRAVTTGFPSQTLITPTQTGQYRLTVTSNIAEPDVLHNTSWIVSFGWFDSQGDETIDMQYLNSNQVRPHAYGVGPSVISFMTAKQTPITVTITKGGTDKASIEVFWVLELLKPELE